MLVGKFPGQSPPDTLGGTPTPARRLCSAGTACFSPPPPRISHAQDIPFCLQTAFHLSPEWRAGSGICILFGVQEAAAEKAKAAKEAKEAKEACEQKQQVIVVLVKC